MAKKKIETNPSFDKMSEALDSTFEGEVDIESEMNEQLANIDNIKKDIEKINDKITLKDAKYMEKQIKNNLNGLENVSNRLEQEIKVGAKPRMFEVYATLANAKMAGIKELMTLRKTIVDLQLKLKEDDDDGGKGKGNVTNNLFLSAPQLAKMLTDAKKKNGMKKVDANFKVDENDR